jgi:hypothetical protein
VDSEKLIEYYNSLFFIAGDGSVNNAISEHLCFECGSAIKERSKLAFFCDKECSERYYRRSGVKAGPPYLRKLEEHKNFRNKIRAQVMRLLKNNYTYQREKFFPQG